MSQSSEPAFTKRNGEEATWCLPIQWITVQERNPHLWYWAVTEPEFCPEGDGTILENKQICPLLQEEDTTSLLPNCSLFIHSGKIAVHVSAHKMSRNAKDPWRTVFLQARFDMNSIKLFMHLAPSSPKSFCFPTHFHHHHLLVS